MPTAEGVLLNLVVGAPQDSERAVRCAAREKQAEDL
jgi:hypothetical protein